MTTTSPRAETGESLENPMPQTYTLCFRSLVYDGRGFAFPCDLAGVVHLDSLSDRDRNNYFYARVMVGRDLAPPEVQTVGLPVARVSQTSMPGLTRPRSTTVS
jgi:hypothetical protein